MGRAIRDDIQALRGWAVLLVLLYHFILGPFQQGNLGVDIFFVISGYLISGHIVSTLDQNRFSFQDFYGRRARRLLPAAYATILLTVAIAPWFLASVELQELTAQVIGAMTFSINFVLMQQTDYFATSSHYKPLLHMWSLAVEEQFYLVLPIVLYFTPARLRRVAIGFMFFFSAGLYVYFITASPSLAFYMLPTRAWELLIGAAGAILFLRQWHPVLLLPALAALCTVPMGIISFAPFGVDAAVVCLAALAVIKINSPALGRISRILGIGALGDISYSLYLVHWPIMAFLYNAHSGDVGLWYRLGGFALSIVLAWALFQLVEQPFRHRPMKWLKGLGLVAATSLVLGGGQFALSSMASDEMVELRRPNWGLNDICDGVTWLDNAACRSGDNPSIILWGDSFAMHLGPGLLATTNEVIGQGTNSACGPLIGLAWNRPSRADPQKWAVSCINYNDKILAGILADPGISTVVMSSPFRDFSVGEIWVRTGDKIEKISATEDEAIRRLHGTVKTLEAGGKRVIVVGPPPTANGEDLSLCVERKMSGKIMLGSQRCEIPRDVVFKQDASTVSFLKASLSGTAASLYLLHDVMCDENWCYADMDGVGLYRDSIHLSHKGSVAVVRRLRLPL